MYSNDPHYRELVRILGEILARQEQATPPQDPDPGTEREARTRSPRPEPVPLIVQPCEKVQ